MNPYHRGVPTRTPTATSYLIMPWYRKFRIRFYMWRIRRSVRKNREKMLEFGTTLAKDTQGPYLEFHRRNILGNEWLRRMHEQDKDNNENHK